MFLAALVTLFVGCKSQQVNKSDNVETTDDVVSTGDVIVKEPLQEKMVCLYGIPPEVYQRLHENDSTKVDSLNPTTPTPVE